MFKLIRRAISIIILAAIVFLVIALYYGGDKFLWFGTKAQEAGHSVKQFSEKAADKADEIKSKKDSLSDLYHRVIEIYDRFLRFLGLRYSQEDKALKDKTLNDRKDKDEGNKKRANQDN
ncbi:MAG: hypothetical protein HQL03_05815 [Nitrospirae bacterium]|nr:hypothetical protein [Nitrospirota bacterium]MBF0591585.1 hypothetical protein [Nitrospirota bacterium]